MKKILSLLFLIGLLMACTSSVENYRADIEKVAGRWHELNDEIRSFRRSSSKEIEKQEDKSDSLHMDEKIIASLSSQELTELKERKHAIEESSTQYESLFEEFSKFYDGWKVDKEKLLELQSILASGRLKDDVEIKLGIVNKYISESASKLEDFKSQSDQVQAEVQEANKTLLSFIDSHKK